MPINERVSSVTQPVVSRSAITFDSPGGRSEITLHSLDGRRLGTVYSGYLDAGRHSFNLTHLSLSSGLVLVMVRNENENYLFRSVVR
ncbi:hypothetical protein CHISP_0190 [Chitinispirillum alkaliphilum]|nr:hypothetical protein CHISP_0190 [Chitinispirillum alkaliphilum]